MAAVTSNSRAGGKTTNAEGFHRAAEALEHKFSARLHIGQIFDHAEDVRIDQDLAIACLVAQSGGEVGNLPGRRVLKSSLEPDASKRGIAVGNAYAEAEFVTEITPFGREPRHFIAHF